MMTKQTIKEYVLENVDLLQLVQEMNSWNGSFEDLCYYENDEYFFNTFFEGNPLEAVRSSFYGNYSYADEYVTFDQLGNLKSNSEWGIAEELKDNIDDIIDELLDNYMHLYIDDELIEMIEEYENK